MSRSKLNVAYLPADISYCSLLKSFSSTPKPTSMPVLKMLLEFTQQWLVPLLNHPLN